ncbi:MAG: tol-pal system protein YbgF [Calditrichaeota bacterium]|nr:MAG: tol-pal system protein YbgF [Calditrichota bacterium]
MYFLKKSRSKSATLFTIVCLLLIVALTACGGSKKSNLETDDSEGINIDELLGVKGDDQKTDSTQNPEEAEVLRLLGIEDSGANTTSTADNQAVNNEEPSVENLKSEMQELEIKLAQKDKTISELQTSLAAKERMLEQLQSTPTQISTPPTLSSGTSTYSSSYRARYKDALNTYNARRYREAIDQFSALLTENSNHSLADNCQYWIGEAYYGLGNFTQAIAEFEKVYSYSKSNKIDAAILKLGLSYKRIGNTEQAKSQFEQLIANYPKSEYVDQARKHLNQ